MKSRDEERIRLEESLNATLRDKFNSYIDQVMTFDFMTTKASQEKLGTLADQIFQGNFKPAQIKTLNQLRKHYLDGLIEAADNSKIAATESQTNFDKARNYNDAIDLYKRALLLDSSNALARMGVQTAIDGLVNMAAHSSQLAAQSQNTLDKERNYREAINLYTAVLLLDRSNMAAIEGAQSVGTQLTHLSLNEEKKETEAPRLPQRSGSKQEVNTADRREQIIELLTMIEKDVSKEKGNGKFEGAMATIEKIILNVKNYKSLQFKEHALEDIQTLAKKALDSIGNKQSGFFKKGDPDAVTHRAFFEKFQAGGVYSSIPLPEQPKPDSGSTHGNR